MSAEIKYAAVIVVATGEDDTVRIAARKADRYDAVTVIAEQERQGCTAALNTILAEANSDLLFIIDGDGTVRSDSVERLYNRYQEGIVLHGREVPRTGNTLIGRINRTVWDLHHRLFQEKPNSVGSSPFFRPPLRIPSHQMS